MRYNNKLINTGKTAATLIMLILKKSMVLFQLTRDQLEVYIIMAIMVFLQLKLL